MTARVYTCDACDAARESYHWRDTAEMRELARIAHADDSAVNVISHCAHIRSVSAGRLAWVGPRSEWADAITIAAIDALATGPAEPAGIVMADPDFCNGAALAQLAELPDSALAYSRPRGSAYYLAIVAPGLRWVGFRHDWCAARLANIRDAIARAS